MLEDAIERICWERINNHAPVSTKCNFWEYRDIATNISVAAKRILIWTLHGSPLDVPIDPGTPLTPQDVFFRDSGSAQKIRVVVFDWPNKFRRYLKIHLHVSEEKLLSPRWWNRKNWP